MAAKRIYKPRSELKALSILKLSALALGVILFFSLLAYFYVNDFSPTARCVKTASQNAVMDIAARGGFDSAGNCINYGIYSVPLYKEGANENIPSLEDIKTAIALKVMQQAPECGDDIEARIAGDNVKVGKMLSHATVDVDMKGIYEKAISLYQSQKSAASISLAELARMAKQGDYVLHINANNSTILYFMTFTKEQVNENPVVYSFGIRK
ncbi:MAG: hypothetical protein PHO02_06750 [Candidatus Nanoarchaeia archaeon]|nr:hypothetical protein [Candidatus Nanoarchaeia archaeon]